MRQGSDGAPAEALFLKEAIARGYCVSLPIFRPAYFDAVVTNPSQAFRVQIKSCAHAKRHSRGTGGPLYRIDLRRWGAVSGRGSGQGYPENAFDVLAAHLADRDQWLLVPWARLPRRILHVPASRLAEPDWVSVFGPPVVTSSNHHGFRGPAGTLASKP